MDLHSENSVQYTTEINKETKQNKINSHQNPSLQMSPEE